MTVALRDKVIEICNKKIGLKGENVGLSFYAFFANKNDNPKLLMEAATWITVENLELIHAKESWPSIFAGACGIY